jgi:hypothetical protein
MRATIDIELAELECAIRRALPIALPIAAASNDVDRLALVLAEKAWIELSRGGFVRVTRTGDQHERLV